MFSLGRGDRYPAGNVVRDPLFVAVTPRKSPNYRVSTVGNWPKPFDLSPMHSPVAPPSAITAFQSPERAGSRLVQPRIAPGDELVILYDLRSSTVCESIDLVLDRSPEFVIERGELYHAPKWKVAWIQAPQPGSPLWKSLEQAVGIRETHLKWELDLLTPLTGAVFETGTRDCKTSADAYSRWMFENDSYSDQNLSPRLVWEHGGIVLKQEDPLINKLNPHYVELSSPNDVGAATLWVVGEGAVPTSLSFRFGMLQMMSLNAR